MKKTGFRDVHGILLLDKPLGASSNQALQRARHLFRAQKAGHTGSLDPLATGLLPICFGEATKIAGHLLGARKAYAAQCRLGTTTTTDDAEGEVVRTRAVPELDDAMIEAALAGLRGRIVQIPPAYSAIKQGGVPLYKRARRGEEVEAPAREVEVHALDLVARDADLLTLHVECGSGTYVRSLARDLGEALGCGAHLTALRRVWVEPFRQPAMWTLEQLQRIHVERGSAGLDELLLPLEQGLAMLPALSLSAEQAIGLRQGKRIAQGIAKDMPLCRALDAANRLVALVEIDGQGQVRVLRGFSAT
ncbi:MAG: tRNA pseudouridine(55) synthase TruB [Proteobacteria bacterium]|nr:tRNA pseudouridine(55) synthase TruB [Pseudomonadota bacterium]